MKKLTRPQVLALARTLKREGRVLPKKGQCVYPSKGSNVGQICNYNGKFYNIGKK